MLKKKRETGEGKGGTEEKKENEAKKVTKKDEEKEWGNKKGEKER